jgi:chromosome segregation ATPase
VQDVPGESDQVADGAPATPRAEEAAGEPSTDWAKEADSARPESVVTPLTPDSDPKGVIAAKQKVLQALGRVNSELAMVASDIRRRTQALLRDNADAAGLVEEARQIEQAVRAKISSAPGRGETLKKLREIDLEVKSVSGAIERAESHDGGALRRGTGAEHAARRKAELKDLRMRLNELRRESMDLRLAAGRAENDVLRSDTELPALVAKAKDLNEQIAGLVAADAEVSALTKRRDELMARKARLVKQLEDAGDGDENPRISKR